MNDKRAIREEDKVQDEWYEAAKKMTPAKLGEFVRHLTEDYQHDYGTVCHAAASAALAAAHAVDHSPNGGITGFQGGAIMWEFIVRWQSLQGKPLRLVQYENMLYPQYAEEFRSISRETWEWMQTEAKKRLADNEAAHGRVVDHWKSIAAGNVPFGYAVAR